MRKIEVVEAAYVHIPFCRRRCHYCDFATGLGTAELIEQYVQVLCREIEAWPLDPYPLQTVFFGGGTPSLLNVGQLEQILTTLAHKIGFAHGAEISLEANPGTVDPQQLQGYRAAGINRISLGVQAFQPHLLEACGRSHGVAEIYEAVEAIREAGIPNFNLDLIFGLPHQTLADWEASLEKVLVLDPSHISLYDLTVEPETRFGRLYQPGDRPLPSDEATVDMYRMARQHLMAAGYDHYEISNFAKPGSQCRHNRVYWLNQSYYGFGMGAVGYVQGRRIHQPKRLHDYFQRVASGQPLAGDPTSLLDEWQETLMLGLRLEEGLKLEALGSRFPESWIQGALRVLDPYRGRGWVIWEDGWLRLLPPDGWLFSNSILTDLFVAAEEVSPQIPLIRETLSVS